jgi:hypothetical protein
VYVGVAWQYRFREQKRCTGVVTTKQTDHLDDQGVIERIIHVLKWVWTGLNWLRIGYSGRLVKTVMILWVPWKMGNFLNSWVNLMSYRRSLLHGVLYYNLHGSQTKVYNFRGNLFLDWRSCVQYLPEYNAHIFPSKYVTKNWLRIIFGHVYSIFKIF